MPAISGAMVQDKAVFIEKTGAEVVVATDAGCLMNIAGCLRRQGSKVRALHLAQVLEQT
jgi:L-lactate dehydrogenase complex protein LldE